MDLKGSTKTGAVCGGFLRIQGPLRRVSIISHHDGTSGSYPLAADERTLDGQTITLHVELNDDVMDLFFLCLYRSKERTYNSPVGEGSGSTGDDWADKAVNLLDISYDLEVPWDVWDYTGNDNMANGLLLRPVPRETGKFYRVGFLEVYGTRASWWFSAPKPEVYLSSVDFLPGIRYTITII